MIVAVYLYCVIFNATRGRYSVVQYNTALHIAWPPKVGTLLNIWSNKDTIFTVCNDWRLCRLANHMMITSHHDVIKWKHFPRYWPFVSRNHRGFPWQRPVTWNFHVFFDVRLNKWLSTQWSRWWLETPWHSLWRHCIVYIRIISAINYRVTTHLVRTMFYWLVSLDRLLWCQMNFKVSCW